MTTTPAALCAQPGCGGTIDGGYCTICGLAPAPAAPPPRPAAAGRGTGGPVPPPAPALPGSAAAAPGSAVAAPGAVVPGSAASRSARAGSAMSGAGRSGPAFSGPGFSGPGFSGPGFSGSASSGSASSGSAVPGSAFSGSAPSGPSRGTTRTRPGSTVTSRGQLGAGLVDIPPVPARDPAAAVLADPRVPEKKRFCGSCESPVGRGRGGQPGLAEGFCPQCGTPFSFTPKLARGELVAGQYEVLGCLAHGGLGWIYLAMDHNLGRRWVVLKGLLNTGDAAAQEAALAERQFLAEVEHPSIVGVYNFVQHADWRTGELAGYIVMEYVGGRSLRQLLQDYRQAGQSLPLPVTLAYAIEILPALGYLHSQGLVYCDFKPDNVIQREEQLKLIDMGGVRRLGDDDSAVYGTVGYQAPEIATLSPSPASDLYSVGRALAVLSFEFAGYQGRYVHSLPDPATVPVLAGHESFLRALRRATHPDPAQRFASAGEMAEQLTGVLREVLAAGDQHPRSAFSVLFSPEVPGKEAAGARQDEAGAPLLAPPAGAAAWLPVPRVDSADPAAGYLATLNTLDPAQLTVALRAACAGEGGTPPAVAQSAETRLAFARALIVAGAASEAGPVLAELARTGSADWRITWYQGLQALAAGSPGNALSAFNAVFDALPGELAPKLALGFAAELAGELETASRYFGLVWTVDRSFVSAAFGLARARLAAGDPGGAVAALAAVPQTSSQYETAQIAAVRLGVSGRHRGSPVTATDLRDAAGRLARLSLDAARQQSLTAEVLDAALAAARARQPLGDGKLLGCEPTERSLRFGLERCYRTQAQLAPDRRRRTELVDQANQVRPRTWS